ncbi:hypothetical protein DFH94DRAFT_658973 [Russula ochroleuca]|uniref:Uncharacterized protein n=1 Tax=Russula ochroleuca TaxID=152965 RepID=A0A9P5JUP0_9AGAM|nr:hypothetical protein DFH94DRAFT_658973 [Russula ochroleuca]
MRTWTHWISMVRLRCTWQFPTRVRRWYSCYSSMVQVSIRRTTGVRPYSRPRQHEDFRRSRSCCQCMFNASKWHDIYKSFVCIFSTLSRKAWKLSSSFCVLWYPPIRSRNEACRLSGDTKW